VVGINPGAADKPEMGFYLENGVTYQVAVEYWEQKLKTTNLYYKRLRNLVEQLGRMGTILWTELVKCQSKNDEELPLQTFRICYQAYLRKELKLMPETWPVIAVARKAYNALAFLCPSQTIIGVPHPTGAFGNFHALFEKDDSNDRILQKDCKMDFTNRQGQAIWLSDCLH
jgi:hypothetical protein